MGRRRRPLDRRPRAALTGESLPYRTRGWGRPRVYTGSVNQFRRDEIPGRGRWGHETTFGQGPPPWVGEAQRKKAPLQRTADPAGAVLPAGGRDRGRSHPRGGLPARLVGPTSGSATVAVLVVACPVRPSCWRPPAAILASMAWLARHGVLIKGGPAGPSSACRVRRLFAFDKTGHADTTGKPELGRGSGPLGGRGPTKRWC